MKKKQNYWLFGLWAVVILLTICVIWEGEIKARKISALESQVSKLQYEMASKVSPMWIEWESRWQVSYVHMAFGSSLNQLWWTYKKRDKPEKLSEITVLKEEDRP